jgi:hypothetical protein
LIEKDSVCSKGVKAPAKSMKEGLLSEKKTFRCYHAKGKNKTRTKVSNQNWLDGLIGNGLK